MRLRQATSTQTVSSWSGSFPHSVVIHFATSPSGFHAPQRSSFSDRSLVASAAPWTNLLLHSFQNGSTAASITLARHAAVSPRTPRVTTATRPSHAVDEERVARLRPAVHGRRVLA